MPYRPAYYFLTTFAPVPVNIRIAFGVSGCYHLANYPFAKELKMADISQSQAKQREIPESLREEGREILSTLPGREEYYERVMDILGSLDETELAVLKEYIYEIAAIPDLEKGELDSLLKDRSEDSRSRSAKRRLNEASLRLVVWIAKDYSGGELLMMDLINEGTVGLLTAVETYQGEGFTFREYASCLIKEKISMAVAEETRSSRVPGYILEKINAVKGVTRRLAEEKGSEPSYAEIAKSMGLTQEELERLVGLAKIPANQEEEGGEDEEQLEVDSDLLEYGYSEDEDY